MNGNAQPMDEAGIAAYVRGRKSPCRHRAMTRMIAKAYRMADAIRAVGVPVVMGGPHVRKKPMSAWPKRWTAPCRRGGAREADERGQEASRMPQAATERYFTLRWMPLPESKTQPQGNPAIPWRQNKSRQFNLVPKVAKHYAPGDRRRWGTFRIIRWNPARLFPMAASSDGNWIFWHSTPLRTNQSVVNELLL